VHYTECCYYI